MGMPLERGVYIQASVEEVEVDGGPVDGGPEGDCSERCGR